MPEHCGRTGAPRGHAGTGGGPGSGMRSRGRARGGGRGRTAGRDGAGGRTDGGGPTGPACFRPEDRLRAGGGRTPSIWQSGRSSRPACGAAASRSAIAGSASRCCNCEAAAAACGSRRTSQATPRGSRSGWGRAGRGDAAVARRRQRAGLDFCREAGEAEGGAVQPRPEQQHQRHGEADSGAAGGDGAAQPFDQSGEAVGQGGGSGGLHDRETNMDGGGLGKRDGALVGPLAGGSTPPPSPPAGGGVTKMRRAPGGLEEDARCGPWSRHWPC